MCRLLDPISIAATRNPCGETRRGTGIRGAGILPVVGAPRFTCDLPPIFFLPRGTVIFVIIKASTYKIHPWPPNALSI
jgi:hypothetical protein